MKNRNKHTLLRRQSGVVLLSVMIAISIIAAILYLMNSESALGVNQASEEMQKIKAQYAAEAGLEHGLWHANEGGCVGDLSIGPAALGDSSYQVTIDAVTNTTTSLEFFPDRDAEIVESDPGANHGTDTKLSVMNSASASYQALYHFDLSSISPNTKIIAARLWFTVKMHDDQGAVHLYPVTKSWDEADVSWNSINGHYNNTSVATIPPQKQSNQLIQLDITSLTQSWVNDASSNHGIILVASSADIMSRYTSSEFGSSNQRPKLEIITAAGPVSPLSVSATGTSKDGFNWQISKANIPAFQAETTYMIQPGSGIEDTYLWNGSHSNKNFGIDSIMSMENDNKQNLLLRFDLETLPQGLKVKQAILKLYLEGGNALSNGVIDIHKVTRSWIEGAYDDVVPPPWGGATYDKYDGFSNWTTDGGDYAPEVIDSIEIPLLTPGWFEWDVTQQITEWLNGETNHGFLLRASAGNVDKINFTSSDSPDSFRHPYLELIVNCECGIPCRNNKNNARLLMVVGNPFSLAPGTQKLKSLFEYWGYQVSLIDDDSLQSTFNTAASNNDVAYITESVVDFKTGNKLTGFAIGVVNEETELNDNLGLSTSFGTPVGDSIEIVDNTHYITRAFPTGPLQVFSEHMEGWSIGGTPAPDLITLANWGSVGGLVVLESGGQMSGGGGTAAGRRVLSPLGGDLFISWPHVNDNGRVLLQRIIEWAAGEGTDTGSGGECDGTYEDDFESGNFEGSTGSLDWTSNPWIEVGESDGPSSGDIRVAEYGGSFRLRTKDNDNGGEGAEREMDLSGAASATLEYLYQRKDLISSDDFTKVEVSVEGGPWVELVRHEGPDNDADYVASGSIDISDYISSSTKIRYITSPTMEGTTKVFFDDVKVTCTL